ncbi:NADH:flavin oxidoreductase [Taibaiella chishuiensis]|uniref:2,4-dienoyl-CoA reductase-like NADH-dependent reductase (Old Yellow Enzyme family) n=1 Tax=Taibaiella chishuiensis TaxID=1434707 RepID=A0A2P8CX34_9BACT|nr:NADH:flavin oxidoreductase [Taibaiella chishuiensis]PSK89509.1 2,4-dienoyl-CoA reductase-like NADH-dependent reductase (Old Yellow Enzyme family) [Taibaiella chishuiensis]
MSVSDLFKPLTMLHGPAMSNRFMLAPLTSQQSEYDGTASEYDQFWMKQLAQSGYGLIQTSAATVEAGGIAFERQLGIHSDAQLPGLTEMARVVREGGALSAVQLHHAGHRAKPAIGGIPAPASGKTLPGVEAITTEEVERIRDSFIAAARRAQAAGFDGVSVHGAFGWILSEFLSPNLNDRKDKYGGNLENRSRFTLEVIEGIRKTCGPDFQIGWRLSVERYGLRLEELRELTADIFDRELIDYLDLALWDSAQVVREGSFAGKTMLSVFTGIPRKGVRLGVAGKIMTARRAAELLDEGCDFVLIARAGILQRDFPLQVQQNPLYESPKLPVTAAYLREGGLSERFIETMRGWQTFVVPGSK